MLQEYGSYANARSAYISSIHPIRWPPTGTQNPATATATKLCVSSALDFFSHSIDLLNVASVRHAVLVNFCQSFFSRAAKKKPKKKRKVGRQNYFYHSNYYSESELLSANRQKLRAKDRDRDTYSS